MKFTQDRADRSFIVYALYSYAKWPSMWADQEPYDLQLMHQASQHYFIHECGLYEEFVKQFLKPEFCNMFIKHYQLSRQAWLN